jgi:glycerol-3-phosphate cytidylyltransferase-like family protein
VDDVLIDAPYEITPKMVASLNIAEVVHGTNSDDIRILSHNGEERYAT